MKYLVVFMCHIINEESISRYNIIKNGLPKGYDIVFCSPTQFEYRIDKNEFDSIENFICLNLTNFFWEHRKCLVRNELCYINIYNKYPKYNNYYFIEYDVIFNKNNTSEKWYSFFNKYNEINIDLLCSHYNKYNFLYTESMWEPNFLYKVEKKINTDILYFGFFPMCMISNRLLCDIKKYYNNNIDSFFEYLIPSMATYKKYNIYCIDKDYVQINKCIERPHYTINNGSISWYKEDKSIYDDNILIHPVKLK